MQRTKVIYGFVNLALQTHVQLRIFVWVTLKSYPCIGGLPLRCNSAARPVISVCVQLPLRSIWDFASATVQSGSGFRFLCGGFRAVAV